MKETEIKLQKKKPKIRGMAFDEHVRGKICNCHDFIKRIKCVNGKRERERERERESSFPWIRHV